MRGHVGFLQVPLDGCAPERALREHKRNERGRRPDERPLGAVPAPGRDRQHEHHQPDDRRQHPVQVLDDRVQVEPRRDVAVAEGPAAVARAGRTAAEPESDTRTTPPTTISAKVAIAVASASRR